MSRVSSPSSISSQAVPIPNPYAPSSGPRQRSMSNGSAYSSFSATAHSPYGSFASRSNLAEASHVSSMYDHPTSNGGLDVSSSSVQTLTAPVYTAYAPSPSLLGTNDPLGRIAGRAPLISFGCGGRLVTCFHGSSTLNTGFDVALSSRQTTGVTVRPLHQIIPESALGNSTASFPGPLFCDPGSPTATLAIRPGASAQTKVNKARVTKYLEDRAEEMSRGLGYLTQGSAERKEAEGKLVLMKLLRIMVENDGRLAGSPDIEQSVRVALVSRLANSALNASASGGGSTTSALFAGPGSEGLPVASDLAYPSLGLPAAVDPSDTILATHTVKASSLDKIQDFLIRGDRRQAYHYALDQRLWAHAMVIASSIDKDAWKEVVTEFIKSEVGSTGSAPLAARGKDAPTTAISGRESLKVAYSLFAGQGAAAGTFPVLD
ncbi:uncharacterized protein STEHIDRAFT_51920 [Stereum hirsutum FP-91666 SS1]|uniref:uncharacterized protein n=1 Tax=Stereum hirsutum (strain FP-91666) TaxID=721885 RepID=UPI000440E875|nr:uncharacterized protein STEHIDRAFT_51920 [Stereum hirsutum FP-91666 SS1]EIM90054.1 hypothetical protein STEHIDRAFT_51920 [Stereum hirsutum FP-91666 SS1]